MAGAALVLRWEQLAVVGFAVLGVGAVVLSRMLVRVDLARGLRAGAYG